MDHDRIIMPILHRFRACGLSRIFGVMSAFKITRRDA
jgi:hypothetical protein